MKVTQFIPYSSPNVLNTTPFVKTYWDTGCGVKSCHCSDGYKLSVSNGTIGLLITFNDKKEMQQYLGEL